MGWGIVAFLSYGRGLPPTIMIQGWVGVGYD